MANPTSDVRARRGKIGEAAAAEELQRLGYRILARNHRCRGGEADLVALDGDCLVFVEVKTRTRLGYALPAESVGWTKQQRLGAAAAHYCAASDEDERPIRFDVVEVILLRGQVAGVVVIRDAFVPE